MDHAGVATELALEHVDGLEPDDYDLLVWMLDTAADNATIVARHGGELAELTGIENRRLLRRWVRLVRPVLLRRSADLMNRYEEGTTVWVVCRGMVVSRGGAAYRDLLARTSRTPRLRTFARVRVRARARGRRSRASARRAPAAARPRPERLVRGRR